jgi:hypothetical protein
MEPITTVLACKWLAAHGIAAHAATAKGTVAAARPVAAGHTGLTATVLGTPIAATTIGGITFLNVYNNLVNDVYKQVKRGWRANPSAYEMRVIGRVAYDEARAALEADGILLTYADRIEMDWLRANFAFAA